MTAEGKVHGGLKDEVWDPTDS